MCSDRIGLQSGALAGAAEPSAICLARAVRGDYERLGQTRNEEEESP